MLRRLILVLLSSCGTGCSTGSPATVGDGTGIEVPPGVQEVFDVGHRLVAAADGGYYIGGQRNFTLNLDTGESNRDILVVRYNEVLATQWQKTLGAGGWDLDTMLVPATDGGVLVCGVLGANLLDMQSTGDAVLYRLTSDGVTVLDRAIGFEGGDRCTAVRESEGGYEMIFSTEGSETQGWQAGTYLLELDAQAAITKSTQLFAGNAFEVRSALYLSDGGWLLVGTKTEGGSTLMLMLWRFSADAQFLWGKSLPGYNLDVSYRSVVETGDGGLVFTGARYAQSPGPLVMFFERWDADGSVVWTRDLDPGLSGVCLALATAPNGDFVGAGSFEDTNGIGAAVRVDPEGNLVWTREILEGEGTFINGLLPEGDDFVISGMTWSEATLWELWIGRMDGDGYLR
ncbi:MAG: hypothetical protein FJ098_10175 [Deltaproteobacteria bacterium]|nr:hypothetical protein [Deltaproteobacteria bacterium]